MEPKVFLQDSSHIRLFRTLVSKPTVPGKPSARYWRYTERVFLPINRSRCDLMKGRLRHDRCFRLIFLHGEYWALIKPHLKKLYFTTECMLRILEDLYTRKIHFVTASVIVISDIDDTLLHSNVSNAMLKFRTLMFTSMENRKAVESMKKSYSGTASRRRSSLLCF